MGLLDFLGNTTSKQNSFQCPHCKKYTPHVKITISEWAAVNNSDDTIAKISGAVCDIMQITRVANIAGISHWKCTQCGLTTIRTSDGSVDTKGRFSK